MKCKSWTQMSGSISYFRGSDFDISKAMRRRNVCIRIAWGKRKGPIDKNG